MTSWRTSSGTCDRCAARTLEGPVPYSGAGPFSFLEDDDSPVIVVIVGDSGGITDDPAEFSCEVPLVIE